MQKAINSLNNHVVLCGYGKYGKEISLNLLTHNIPFVVIDHAVDKIDRLQHSDPPLLYIEGDATQDETLLAAGILRARATITALADDSDNLYIVLTARQLNPRLNIISRAMEPKAGKKLLKAGANHVVMPEQIGGFYMATLVSKPGALEFFSFITSENHADIGFEEIRYEQLQPQFRTLPIRELHLRHQTGINIIGYRNQDGRYEINPSPDIALQPGCSFIVLGSNVQLKKLHELLGAVN
ncbi:MAG: potassium channel protein [Saprospiraceae bacterium]|nr:potassium channel protein [Saprospiraceae bacterium]